MYQTAADVSPMSGVDKVVLDRHHTHQHSRRTICPTGHMTGTCHHVTR